MPYKKGDERKYFSMLITLLVIISVIIAALVYSLTGVDSEDINEIPAISPGSELAFPTAPPDIPQPTFPPSTE